MGNSDPKHPETSADTIMAPGVTPPAPGSPASPASSAVVPSVPSMAVPSLPSPVSATSISGILSTSFSPGSGPRPVVARRYEVLGLVGSGGMGTVYRARDTELDELVALKVLRKELADDHTVLERFRREAKLARRVTHQNVARVYDIGEHEGEKFLTMEFIEGEPLSALMSREGAVSLPRAVQIATAIADGLASAHAAGVVHRDLKPDNVLLDKAGRVVITDFGIARAFITASGGLAAGNTMGLLLGTPAYMAPEQVEGRNDIDARADIYAFGVVLYELCTGERAWPGQSLISVAAARLYQAPPDPRIKRADLPPQCAELVLACMAKLPAERPASMADVKARLAAIHFTPAPVVSPVAAPASPAAHHAAEPSGSDKAVAVLPFRNAGPAEDDYLAEELTDDLIDSLSMTRGLKVRARGAVQRFKGGGHDPRDVGRELGVQVVVEGSVRRARGSVRVSARLVGVADGFQLWAKRFDRPEQEVLAINDEAARAIVEALTLDTAAAERAARAAPQSAEAIDLYLRGRHEYRKFWAENQRKAIALFEQAIALAPDDPTIQSALAMARARLCFFTGTADLDKARVAAERAVEMAPHLGEPQVALGSVLFQMGDSVGAVRAFKRAIAKSPGLAEAHSGLGRILSEAGALDEGIRRLEAALSLDVEAPLAASALSRAYALQGKWDECDRQTELIKLREGTFSYWSVRARMALWSGERAVAEQALKELPPEELTLGLPRVVLELVRTGRMPPDAPDFGTLAGDTDGGWRRRVFFLQLNAEILGSLGNHAESLAAVRAAAEQGLVDLAWLDACPMLGALRSEPGFAVARAIVKTRADAILAAARE